MMQTAEPRHRYDLVASYGIRSCFTAGRCSFRQREMRSIVMIVADVFFHQPFQMTFIQHDHMVEQISAAVADPALPNAILPRTSEAGSLWLDAEAFHGTYHFCVKVSGSVKD